MNFNNFRLLEPIDDDDPELNVELKDGSIRGINIGEEHRAWLGIPYAKPPLGKQEKKSAV